MAVVPLAALPGLADEALDLVVAAQADPATSCPYLGTGRDGVVAELDDLDLPWREHMLVCVRDGRVVAAAVADHDLELGRSWLHGPWAVDDAVWEASARALVDALVDRLPDGISDHELCGTPANTRLAALAASLGWAAGPVNVSYETRTVDGWPPPDPAVRPATEADLGGVAAIHDDAFPGTYHSARQLVADPDRFTVVADDAAGRLVGYASAQVQPDGGGYLDFIAVAPPARGHGVGTRLLATIGRAVLDAAPAHRMHLTVTGDNPAVRLYERFGLTRGAELVAYRSTRPDPTTAPQAADRPEGAEPA